MTLRVDSYRQVVAVTISTAADGLADAVDIVGYKPTGIVMTTAWNAANLTFQGSPDNSTFRNVYSDTGGELTVTGTQSASIALSQATAQMLGSYRYLKVRSGASGGAVAQTTERALTLVVEPRV